MSEPPIIPPIPDAARWYSAAALWRALHRAARTSGRKAVGSALTLFLCLKDQDTPKWAKGVIVGALGYMILPADMIPDVLPAVGWSDDWTTIAAALATVAAHVKSEHKLRAAVLVDRLFRTPESMARESID